jgi:hypothetical protein
MIRDGLAEEGHEVQVHANPKTGWHVAIISANNAEDAGIRAEGRLAGSAGGGSSGFAAGGVIGAVQATGQGSGWASFRQALGT